MKTYCALLQLDSPYKCETYSYIDYINFEKQSDKSSRLLKDKIYWNKEFETIPDLPYIPGSVESSNHEDDIVGKRIEFKLNKKLVRNIKNYCKDSNISLFNFFMAVYSIYIHGITGLDDFVIGSPILNRTNYKEKHTAGMFINMAAFRINFTGVKTFHDFIKLIATKSLKMLKHQKYSYQSLIEDLRKKYGNIPSLYNTVFSYQVTSAQSDEIFVNYSTDWTFNGNSAENLAIQVFDLDKKGTLTISYDYKTSIYLEEDISSIHNRILNLINQIIGSQNVQISDLELVTPKEKNILLNKFNHTNSWYNNSLTLIDLFEKNVIKNPNDIAIIYDSIKYSYKDINNMTNIIANSIGDIKGEKIAVLCEKSAWTVASFLGIMKSGNCYIPIDMEYPKERIQYILENSNASVLITPRENDISQTFKSKIVLNTLKNLTPSNFPNRATPEDLAYIIYTSGTTGKPKGVKIKHKNIINTLIWRKNFYKFNKYTTVYQIPSFSFDSSVEDLFTPLISGGKIIIPTTPKIDLNKICDALKHYNVNHFLVVPSVYKILLREKAELLKNLKFITIAGEDFNMSLVKEHFKKLPNVRLINEYGPTENSVCSTFYELNVNSSKIYIGKPISNCKCYCLNNDLNLLPIGTVGELYVSGPGVSDGYLNNPKITKERFLNNPFNENYKLYKTGDLIKLSADGNISFIGRNDHQIKLHGLRIELKEIEQTILNNPNVLDVVVAKKENLAGKEILVAYVIAKNNNLDISKLLDNLKENLPQYMIPSIVKLEEFPLTPNGKIDIKSLPLPKASTNNKQFMAPRDNFDLELIDTIEKTLNLSNISLLDTILGAGGDSLSAITLSAKISSLFNVQIGMKELLTDFTIKDISDYIKRNMSKKTNKFEIAKAPSMLYYPLSSAQQRIYYNTKMIDEENTVYNVPGYILIDEKLDKNKIKFVFNKLIERHSILRTSFVIVEDQPVQKILPNVTIDIPVFSNKSSEMENIIKNFPKPFNLENAPLIRVELHYIDNQKTMILMDSHHIVMDGTSLNNLVRDFTQLYNEEPLKPLSIEYKDYSVWENKFNLSEDILPFEKYWVKKISGSESTALNLPYDFKLSTNRTYKGNTITETLDEFYFDKVKSLSKSLGTSPYALFLSVFFVLLYKYTGQTDINVGTPIANRDISELQDIIGMFVNNIVVRGNIDPDESFKDFLIKIGNQTLSDLSNQPYPFDMLVKKLHVPSDNTRNPLFDVFFIYQNFEETSVKIGNKNCSIVQIPNNISKFNLSLEIKPSTNTINLEYCTDLFKIETVERLFGHYINLLNTILANVNQKISDISILSSEERNTILNKFNDTAIKYNPNKTISYLFEEQSKRTPNKIALVFGNTKLTYKALNEKANQLANYLRKNNIVPNDIIGIMLPRSTDLIVAILGILKSGACYIPIDPTFPENRITYMLKNSNAKMLITTNELLDTIDYENKICISSEEIYLQDCKNIEMVNSPEDLAYIIYTSGSTGLPKGVMLKHKSLSNLCVYLNKNVEFLQNKCKFKNMISVTTASFDIFIFETLVCLQRGLKVIIANEDEQRIPVLLDLLIKKNDGNLIQMTPSRMQILLDNIEDMPNLSNIKYVTLAGEALPLKLRDQLIKLGVKKVYNGYGPSETTVFSSFTDVSYVKEISIGKPIGNTQMYILDKNFNPVPVGIEGELYISGDGVGKGYLNRDDLTSERYLKNPFIKNGIMYKVGDLCKYDSDGNIYYLGRVDNQIKIRGLRIELGEIENKILEFPNIQKAKVVKQLIGNREIISAYYISNKKIKASDLRKFLNNSLPKYMIPSYFTALDKFPYTPNGKIDKNALPIPSGVLQVEKSSYIAPKTDLEIAFVSIWEDVLNTKPIGIKDNFFELGGDSILAMNLVIRLLKITKNVKYSDIFAYPTIADLIQKIQSSSDKYSDDIEIDLTDKYNDLLLQPAKKVKIPNEFNNILLTGATGFLGIHILSEFLNTENGKAYVLVRKDPGVSVNDKFSNRLHYYFGNKYDKYLNERIIVLEGDITEDGFGLKQEDLFNLGNSIDIIIHSAAKVSHYGNYQDFFNTNVKSIKKIIDFANLFKKEIFHISTVSVSGDSLSEPTNFSEKDLYIGQKLDNVYVRSKFEAEKLILDSILNGTRAHILRIGNLTPRFSDGKFQENMNENAFFERLKTFTKLKVIPESLMDKHLEFTPIDSAAQAILKILKYTDSNTVVYHIFNHKYVYIKNLLEIMNSLNMNINSVSNEEFTKIIKNILNNSKTDILNSLINDLDKDLNLNYYSNKINITSDRTIKFLNSCGFEWPTIDKKYISNLLKLIKGE